MNDLNKKLKTVIIGWNYLWEILEKEVKSPNNSTEVLMELYRYQVELYSAKYRLNLFEEKANNIDLSSADIELIGDALSRYIATFQAYAITIENLLKK